MSALIFLFFGGYFFLMGIFDPSPGWWSSWFCGDIILLILLVLGGGLGKLAGGEPGTSLGDVLSSRKHNKALKKSGRVIADLPVQVVYYPMLPTGYYNDWIKTKDNNFYRPINAKDYSRLIEALEENGML